MIDDKTRASEIESFESNIFHVQQFLPQNERPAMYCFVSHTTPQYSVIDWLRDTLLHIVSLDGLLVRLCHLFIHILITDTVLWIKGTRMCSTSKHIHILRTRM